MSESHHHHKASTVSAGALSSSIALSSPYSSVRRMRNTAVLVKWIEDHQSNPYPTKAEKQYLAYYSGMNLTQLSTWFANARRRIKKIGMKTWLEGRSTFSLDYFPPTAAARLTDHSSFTGSSYSALASTSPYATPYSPIQGPLGSNLHSSYPGPHQYSSLTAAAGSQVTNCLTGYDASLQPTSSATSPLSYYGVSRHSMMMPALPMQWPSTPLLPSTSVSFPALQSRPSSGNSAQLHSPITAQVYTADTMQLRAHSAQSIDVGDSSYSLQQHSPDQMLPECASSEPVNPMLSDHKPGTTALQN